MGLTTTVTKTFTLFLVASGLLVWEVSFATGGPSEDPLRAEVLREVSMNYLLALSTPHAETLASRILLGEDPENRILSKRTHDLAFIRGLTPEGSVYGRRGKDGAAYVKIEFFGRRTVRDFTRQLKTLEPVESILLDLRGCPGGDWRTAVQFLGLFISSGTRIAQISDRSGTSDVFSGGSGEMNQEVTVLVDSSTASTAELVAFALERHRGSRVLGGPTRGKRILQSLYPISPERLLLLTTGSWRLSR